MQEQATATVEERLSHLEWHNECQNDLNESVWELSETRDQCRGPQRTAWAFTAFKRGNKRLTRILGQHSI